MATEKVISDEECNNFKLVVNKITGDLQCASCGVIFKAAGTFDDSMYDKESCLGA